MAHLWNADLYQQKHAFVYQYGSSLIDWLNPQLGEEVLDVGCGTGELTDQIAQTGAKVTGVDQSEKMVERAKQQYPDISFYVQDATQLSGLHQFDAVFSNAALHWIKDASAVLQQIYQHLKPTGRLVAELGGKGNISQIISALNQQRTKLRYPVINVSEQWFFPSVGEYGNLLESEGFEVQQAQYFHRDTALADNGIKEWIRMFASRWLTDIADHHIEKLLEATQESLRSSLYRDETWYADYKRLRILAVKV
ncbi:MAG: methyltransferase domain-containing protein [Bacteroidota bacterium]